MLAVPTPAKAAKVAENPRYVTSAVLRALGTLASAKGQQFTVEALAKVTPDLGAVRRQRAITKLLGLQFITYRRMVVGQAAHSVYTITAEGAAAIAAAGQGAMLLTGNGGTRPGGAGTFRARLWQLVRIRRVLQAEDAVQLLVDAGDSRFISKRNQANQYLRTWAANGVLQLSTQRGPRGQKRYVLVTDPGPAVPALRGGPA